MLYSRTHDSLPEGILERIQDEGAPIPEIEMAENGDGAIYSFEWPDLIVDVTVMPLVERVIRAACHCQLICLIYDGKLPRRGRRLIARLEETRLGLRFEIEPKRDEELRERGSSGGCASSWIHSFTFRKRFTTDEGDCCSIWIAISIAGRS